MIYWSRWPVEITIEHRCYIHPEMILFTRTQVIVPRKTVAGRGNWCQENKRRTWKRWKLQILGVQASTVTTIHNREGQGQTHLRLLFPPIFLLFHYYSIFYFYFRSYILYLNYIWTVVFAERYFHLFKEIACDDLYQLFWIIGILGNQLVHKNSWHPLIIVTDTRVVLCQAADIHCDKFWDPFFLWCNRDIVAVMHFLMTWQYSQVCIIEMRARWTWNRFWCKFGSKIIRISFAWV